jgi:hypothetical protein
MIPRACEVQVRRLDSIGSYRRAGTAQSRYPIFENIIHNYVQPKLQQWIRVMYL